MLAFFVGLVIGNFFGMIVSGLMNASYEADRQREEENADNLDR